MFIAKCTSLKPNPLSALPGEKVGFYRPTGEPVPITSSQIDGYTTEDTMFLPNTMKYEKYQDLTWLESGPRPWAAGEEMSVSGNEMLSTRWPDSEEEFLYNGDGYPLANDANAYYSIRKTDSFDEIKNLSSTNPTEVVPMRYHEELQVKEMLTKEEEKVTIPRVGNSPTETPADSDLFKELEGKDLIDFLMSDEPTHPLEKAKKEEEQVEMQETYLAIPRQITANSEDKRLPKMVILKTPKRPHNNPSTVNIGDLGMSIADRIKASGKRPKTKRYSDMIAEEDSDDDDDMMEKPRKRSRRSSTTSSASSIDRYRELRDKNNEASRRSRLNRKEKERDLMKSLEEAERDNLRLKARANELEKLVHSLRQLLLQVVLNKGSHSNR